MPSSRQSQIFLYRFDVYLSLQDRRGQRVDLQKLLAIRDEIVRHFGGLTMTSLFGNPIYDGFWRSPKSRKMAQDKNSIFTVLAPQTSETRDFFLVNRERWRETLDYEELLITVHELEAI